MGQGKLRYVNVKARGVKCFLSVSYVALYRDDLSLHTTCPTKKAPRLTARFPLCIQLFLLAQSRRQIVQAEKKKIINYFDKMACKAFHKSSAGP